VVACGVDRGGDLYVWKSVPEMPYAVPVVVGAENCGVVVATGRAVEAWTAGDRVVSEVIIDSCGSCRRCRLGDDLHCPGKRDLGRLVDGAFAEYFVAPAGRLHRIPEAVSWRAAVLTEMAAVVARCLLETVTIRAGDAVAVIGPGPIGLIATQLARASGAASVVTIGLASDTARLELARDLGATETSTLEADTGPADLRSRHPDGFDVVVEGTGGISGVSLAIALAAPHGTIAAIGTPLGRGVDVPWADIALKNLTIRGTYAHRWSTFERVLALMGTGQLRTECLYTRSYPLEDWERAFHDVDSSADLVKVGICPAELI
jgi:threonine dehydrogenase-like Zn-dependent dehydrogenase